MPGLDSANNYDIGHMPSPAPEKNKPPQIARVRKVNLEAKKLNPEIEAQKKKNSEILLSISTGVAKIFDTTLANDVTKGLVAAGYEGSGRLTKDNLPDAEQIRQRTESSGFTVMVAADLLSHEIDPQLNKDIIALEKELSNDAAKANANDEQEARSNDITKRQLRIQQAIYKAIRGNAVDQKNPDVKIAITQLKKMSEKSSVQEIVQAFGNDEIKADYAEWLKNPANQKPEPIRPNNIAEKIYNDYVSLVVSRASQDPDLTKFAEEPSSLTVNIRKTEPITKLNASVVSIMGDVGGERVKKDWLGNEKIVEAEARETIEVGVERAVALAETAKQEKWNKKRQKDENWFSHVGEKIKNGIDRSWRSMFSEKNHHAKELRHGLRLMGNAGVETGLTAEFLEKVDLAARDQIEKAREHMSKWDTFKAKAGDFFSEMVGRERELHRVKEDIVKKWRDEFNANPVNDKNPIFDLVMSDLASREAIAQRVAGNSLDTLQLSGEGKTTETIKVEKDSDVGKILNEKVIQVALKDALARYKLNPSAFDGKISTKTRVELDKTLTNLFESSEFAKLKEQLSPEQQALLTDSFTYGNNIIAQIEEVLIRQALEQSDFLAKVDTFKIDLELSLGTAQYGPNGEISPTGIERNRIKREVFNQLRERKPFSEQDVDGGMKRFAFVDSADKLVNNPIGWSIAGFFGGRFVTSSAKALAGGIGAGVLAGGRAGFREWHKLKSELAQVDIERALGYQRVEEAKKYHELNSFLTKSLVMSEHSDQINSLITKISEKPTSEDVTSLAAAIVNGEARITLGFRHGINLIGAKNVGGTELAQRQNYQFERGAFDLAQAKARAKLKEISTKQPDLWKQLRSEWGFSDKQFDNIQGVDLILNKLRETQEVNLKGTSKIDTKYTKVLQKVTVDQEQTLQDRETAFTKFRAWTSLKRALGTAVTSGFISYGVGLLADTVSFDSTHVENISSPIVSPNSPSHLYGIGEIDGTKMHAHLPAGLELRPVPASLANGHKDFELFVSGDKEPIVSHIEITRDGSFILSEETRSQLDANGVHLTSDNLPTHVLTEISSAIEPASEALSQAEHTSIRFGDLPGSDEGGFWNWMMGSMRGNNSDVDINTTTNGAYKLFRLYQLGRGNDNVRIQEEDAIPYHRIVHYVTTKWDGKEVQEFIPAANPTNMVIDDLPSLFATSEGHQRIGDAIANAVHKHNEGMTLSRLDDLLYRVSAGDEMLKPDDARYVLEQLGAYPTEQIVPEAIVETNIDSVTPHDILFSVDAPIVREVACAVAPRTINGVVIPLIIDLPRRALEAPEGTKAPTVKVVSSTAPPRGSSSATGSSTSSGTAPATTVTTNHVSASNKKDEPKNAKDKMGGKPKSDETTKSKDKPKDKDNIETNKVASTIPYEEDERNYGRDERDDMMLSIDDDGSNPIDTNNSTISTNAPLTPSTTPKTKGGKPKSDETTKSKDKPKDKDNIETNKVASTIPYEEDERNYGRDERDDMMLSIDDDGSNPIDTNNSTISTNAPLTPSTTPKTKGGKPKSDETTKSKDKPKDKDNIETNKVASTIPYEEDERNYGRDERDDMMLSIDDDGSNPIDTNNSTISTNAPLTPSTTPKTKGGKPKSDETTKSKDKPKDKDNIETNKVASTIPYEEDERNYGRDERDDMMLSIDDDGSNPIDTNNSTISTNAPLTPSTTPKTKGGKPKSDETTKSKDKPKDKDNIETNKVASTIPYEEDERNYGRDERDDMMLSIDDDGSNPIDTNNSTISTNAPLTPSTTPKTKGGKPKSDETTKSKDKPKDKDNIETNKVASTIPYEEDERNYGRDERDDMMLSIDDDGSNPIDTNNSTISTNAPLTPSTTPKTKGGKPKSDETTKSKDKPKDKDNIETNKVASTIPYEEDERNYGRDERDDMMLSIDDDGSNPIDIKTLSDDERLDVKKQIKQDININPVSEEKVDATIPLSLAEVKKDIATHMRENQSLSEFAELEYGAIAEFIEGLSENQITAIIDSMANRPDLQAKYRAATIGLQVLPASVRESRNQYRQRIEGSKKLQAELSKRLEVAKNRRLASIFDKDFPEKFEATLKWGEPTKEQLTLATLPPRAEGTLHLPDNVSLNEEGLSETVNQYNSEYQDVFNVGKNLYLKAEKSSDASADPTEREILDFLESKVDDLKSLKKSLGKGWTEKDQDILDKHASTHRNILKTAMQVESMRKFVDEYRAGNIKTIDITSYHIPASKPKAGKVKITPERKGINSSSLALLSCFQVDGKPLDQDYLFSPEANIDWKVGGELIETTHPSRDLHVDWRNPKNGQQQSMDLHFVDDNHTPDSNSLSLLEENGFSDNKNGYRPVFSNNKNEIINRSSEEIQQLTDLIDEQSKIQSEYQQLVNRIGDEDTEGSFAQRISQATEQIYNQLYHLSDDKESTPIDTIMRIFNKYDDNGQEAFPFAHAAIEADGHRHIDAVLQSNVEDMFLGAILTANEDALSKLPPHTAARIRKLQKQVNIDDIAVLEFSRNHNKPVDVTDRNRAQVFLREITDGNAINFVLDQQDDYYRKLGLPRPFDRQEIMDKLASKS